MTKQTVLTTADYARAYGWNVEEVEFRLDGNFYHKPTNTVLGAIKELKFDVNLRLKKLERDAKKAEKALIKRDLVPTAMAILKQSLPDAKVFINRTSPNVVLNGITFYIMIGLAEEYGNNICFYMNDMTADHINKHITRAKVRIGTESDHRFILDASGGISLQELPNIIEHIANRIGDKE